MSLENRTYQVIQSTTQATPDPDEAYYRNYDSTSGGNNTGLSDPIIDQLTTQARETINQAQRKVLYQKVAERLAVDLPVVPLFYVDAPFFEAKNVHGIYEVQYLRVFWNDIYQT